MVRNCVFLSYQHDSAPALHELAQELRVRGIVPWVDKLPGGFAAGDGSEDEARRVIRDESSAFLLYLTEKSLKSDFIRKIELSEALARRKREPGFPIFVASPEYGMGQLSDLTEQHFGFSLGSFHGYTLDTKAGETLDGFFLRVAVAVLEKHLILAPADDPNAIELQVSSREILPGTPSELLRIDATSLVEASVDSSQAWSRLLSGLVDVKRQLTLRYGHTRLLVNGSKHFTAAFMVGRVFNRFPLDIRHKPTAFWRSDGVVELPDEFEIIHRPGSYTERTLLVEFATGEKDTAAGVDALIASGELADGGRVRVRPKAGRVEVTEMISRSIARAAYREVDRAANTKKTDEVHLFVAAPQATFMTLATLFHGMPDVHLYEWSGMQYRKSAIVPSAI